MRVSFELNGAERTLECEPRCTLIDGRKAGQGRAAGARRPAQSRAAGVKGVGEPPLIPTAAAIANAVFDAIGVRCRNLPLKREKLIR